MTAALRITILRIISFLIFIAAAATLIHPAFAIDATASTTRREKVQTRIETRKENAESRIAAIKEKMATREAALKAKLDAFRDKKKAEIAQRVNTNLNKINENQTTQMQKHLDKMSVLLDKVETRINQGTPDIKDPAGAKAAIASARTAIASASNAVSAQAEKDYTITVTSETQVRADAQKMRDLLKTDLTSVRKLVIDAKQAVSNVITTARSATKEVTPSGQQ